MLTGQIHCHQRSLHPIPPSPLSLLPVLPPPSQSQHKEATDTTRYCSLQSSKPDPNTTVQMSQDTHHSMNGHSWSPQHKLPHRGKWGKSADHCSGAGLVAVAADAGCWCWYYWTAGEDAVVWIPHQLHCLGESPAAAIVWKQHIDFVCKNVQKAQNCTYLAYKLH